MFLVPQVSSNLSKVSNRKVWDVVLSEQFDYLPTIIYKSLRAYLTKDNSAKDPEVVYDASSKQPLIALIMLSMEIIRFVANERGDRSMSYLNIGQLRSLGASAPLTQDDNLVFRLLELTD